VELLLSKTELAFIQGSREFTREQARVIRYRINKKMKASKEAMNAEIGTKLIPIGVKDGPNSGNQLLEHSLAVFGTFAFRKWRQKRRRR
jgi:hypothetical protein